jgi:predicted ester cyclase
MNEQEMNERVFHRLFDEAFTKGDTSVIDEIVSPNLKEHQDIDRPTREGVKELIRNLHTTFPDFRCDIQDLTAIGNRVWGRIKGGGTDTGGFEERPPTGKHVTVDTMELCLFEQGKIVEHWGVVDRVSILKQLGIIPRQGERSSERNR